MRLVSVLENQNIEKRIAVTPEIAKKYISLGFDVSLQKNYGAHLGFDDNSYKELGVEILNEEKDILNKADIIIPAPCFTETEGIFVNTEGRPQISAQVKEPLPNVNEAWKFFLKFAEYNKISLGFKSFEELRSLMFKKFPHLSRLDIIKPNNFIKSKKKLKKIKNLSIKPSIENFYMTNIVSRMSKVMADCSKNKK